MQDRELQIDFVRILKGLRRNILYILMFAAEGALVVFLGTVLFLEPRYQSTVMFYVNNSAQTAGEKSGSITTGDLAASKTLVNSYGVILRSREMLEAVIAYAEVSRTYEEVREMIQASAVNSTEFFEVVVTSPDPEEAEQIANAIARFLPLRIGEILGGASAKIVDYAVAASQPSSPGYGESIGVGVLGGLILGIGGACVEAVLDTTVRCQKDIAAHCTYPILTVIPEKGKKEDRYKLLRSKLAYLLKEIPGTKILGITSPTRGEGKNLTAENLVLSMERQGKRVILLDCDLRAAPEAGPAPGTAELLTGKVSLETLLEHHDFGKQPVLAIPAGQPGESAGDLLSGAALAELAWTLRGSWDAVILNLPVMAEAEDVLPVLGYLDGVLLTVRRDVCKGEALEFAAEQLDFVKAKVLGIVYQEQKPPGKREAPAIRKKVLWNRRAPCKPVL